MPTRCVSETDNGCVICFVEFFDGDFDVVDQRYFSLFQMQNNAVLVNILLQVGDDNAVQHRGCTGLQSPTHKPLLILVDQA